MMRRIYGSAYESNKIAEENWEEWRSIETPVPLAEATPWQKEVNRMNDELNAALRQLQDPSGSPTPAP